MLAITKLNNVDSKNQKVAKTRNGKIIVLSKCTVYGGKKLRFIK